MKEQGYAWWIERLRWATENCDYIRLDHFRGFEQFWEIVASEPTAMHGHWVDGPKDDLFVKVRRRSGDYRFLPKISATSRRKFTPCGNGCRFPGSRCCSLVLGMPAPHLSAQRFTPDQVVYTGTHDNDTLVGWWASGASELERRHAEAYLGRAEDGIHWSFIRAAQASVASLAVVPLQDVLGLGSEARMNTPSLHGETGSGDCNRAR